MATVISAVQIAPVNIQERKALGIKPGDTVKVHQKIQDKGKTRIQVFDGLVLATKHGAEPGATFTVRKVASGVGVEKIFPLYSPLIDKIEIVKRAKVRRAKLYYIREKVARQIKRQMRRMSLVSMGTESEIEAAARKEAEAVAEAERAQQAEAEQVAAVEAEQAIESTDAAETKAVESTETAAEETASTETANEEAAPVEEEIVAENAKSEEAKKEAENKAETEPEATQEEKK